MFLQPRSWLRTICSLMKRYSAQSFYAWATSTILTENPKNARCNQQQTSVRFLAIMAISGQNYRNYTRSFFEKDLIMLTTPLLMSELVRNATSNLGELALWPNILSGGFTKAGR